MKKLIYLFVISLIILSCSKNDDSDDSQKKPIPGEWKLIMITSDETYDPTIIDYSDKNIIYNFTPYKRYNTPESGYELIISGAENAGYPNGKYEYHFGEDYLHPGPWGENDEKVILVSINGAKYSYTLTDGIMILGMSHIKGGSDYIFEKVK